MRPVVGSTTTTLPLYGPSASTAARRISRSSPSTLSFMVESAKVGNFQGPPVTIERRRARELDAAVVRTEVRTTVTRRAELPVLVRATASWGAGALAVAVAGLAAIFVAALLADGLC